MRTAAKRFPPQSTAGKQLRKLASLSLLALITLSGHVVSAQSADHAFTQTTLTLEWSESPEQLAANLHELNSAFAAAKGSLGSRFANYSIRNAGTSRFELYDREGLYITSQERRDYSHQLEIRLKSGMTVDFEALPQNKLITLVIDAYAKTDSEIRRLVHATEVDSALAARNRLNTPSALTVSITVTDVEEPPVVTSLFHPSSNHQRGFLLRLNARDGAYRIRGDRMFRDPENQPLFFKQHAEDVEIQEFLGTSPNFGTRTVNIGSTEHDTNYIVGNSPLTDGTIVRVRVEDSTIVITPVAGESDGIRKAEIWVRGWDHRGPTAVLPRLDPATAESLAKVTVLVQTGNNQLPQWPGNATGFNINVREGFTGPLVPQFGTWDATDPDHDAITYALMDTTTRDACAGPPARPGISFAGACIRLESTVSVVLQVYGDLDYELVRNDPVGRFTLLAIDARGAVAEAMFHMRVLDLDEPISGGFKTSALSIHLPTTAVKRFDLSELFFDPEDTHALTFRATSGSTQIISVNERPDPILEIRALQIGRTTVHAWATSTTGETLHSSMTVLVKDTNEPPEFPGGVTQYSLHVAETAPVGTKLTTTISATDPDFGDVLNFTLEENAHFRLSSEGLPVNEIQLVTKAPLDFETQARYVLTLTVSDDVTSDDVEVVINLLDIDESVRATDTVIAPIHLSVNGTHSFDATVHFFDEDGQTPNIRVGAFDASIADIFVRDTGEVEIFAKSNGTTDVTLTATDPSGGIAAKRFTVIVEQSEAPVVARPVPDQTMQPGLLEISLAGLFTDPDSDVSIAEVSSSDEDVVWAIRPRNEPDTLVLYAWKVGTSEITVVGRDPAGNETSYTFSVTVTSEEAPVTDALIPDQTLTLGQRLGSLSLLEAFSTADEQPTSFEISSSNASSVIAVIADEDVIAWWHSLDCAQKVAAVGDTGGADASNPYCQEFVSLSVQRKVIVRAVAGHHALLHGIATGSADITVTASYDSGASTTTTFTATVETMVASAAASLPQRVAYVGEPVLITVQDLVGAESAVNGLKIAVRERDIASVHLSDDRQTIEINGTDIGSTSVALLAIDATGQHHAVQFSLRVANQVPQVSQSSFELVLEVGEEPYVQDLQQVFSDANALRFTLTTNHEIELINASIQGSNLLVSPLRKGSTQLTVSATDTFGASATVVFEVTVREVLLDEAATNALTGYGRAVLNSVSSVIGARFEERLHASDFQPDRPTKPADLSNQLPNIAQSITPSRIFDDVSMQAESNPHTMSTSSYGDSLPRISQKFLKSDGSRYWTIWTDSDTQSYQGDGHRGQTRAYYVGTDVVLNNQIQAGLAGSHISGSGDYTFGNAQRWFDTEQSFISPYIRYQVGDEASVWAIATVGSGEMLTTEQLDNVPMMTRDLRSSALIVGATRALLNVRGLDLAWRSDIAQLSMEANSTDRNHDSLTAEVHRVRSGLTTSFNIPLTTNTSLEPFATINLRYDGGSDQAGIGIEAVTGARLSAGAFGFELQNRRFELRDQQDYLERGFSISTTYNPSKDPMGWSLSLAPTWGTAKQSYDPFISTQGRVAQFSSWDESRSEPTAFSVEGSLSYGILTNRDRFILTPYLQTRSPANDEYRLGVRLEGATLSTQVFEIDIVATSVSQYANETDRGIALFARLRL